VKRLAASLEVAARENGFSDKDRRKIVLASVARYRQVMRQLAGEGNLGVWYTQVDIDEFRTRFDSLLRERQRKELDKGLAKARTRDSMQELTKLTRIEDGQPRIVPDPPVIVPLRDLLGELAGAVNIEKELRTLIGQYRRTLQPDRRGAARAVRVRRHGPQGGRRGQRGDPLLDRPDARPRRRPTRFSSRSRRPRTPCSPGSPGPAVQTTRAKGW